MKETKNISSYQMDPEQEFYHWIKKKVGAVGWLLIIS